MRVLCRNPSKIEGTSEVFINRIGYKIKWVPEGVQRQNPSYRDDPKHSYRKGAEDRKILRRRDQKKIRKIRKKKKSLEKGLEEVAISNRSGRKKKLTQLKQGRKFIFQNIGRMTQKIQKERLRQEGMSTQKSF